jgi:hypothetical protein
MTERGNLADVVEILEPRRLRRLRHRNGRHGVSPNGNAGCSLPHFMLHRNIDDGGRRSRSIESMHCLDPAETLRLC